MTKLGPRTEVYSWNGPPEIRVSTMPVEHRGRQWLQHVVEGTEGGDGVVVVPVFAGKLLLVRHYRPVTGLTLTEFPRGFGRAADDGVSAEEQACLEGARELLEETGLIASNTKFLGHIWPDSGLLGTRVAVVCVETSAALIPESSDGEVDSRTWVHPNEVNHLIHSGQMRDGISLAAYALWRSSIAP